MRIAREVLDSFGCDTPAFGMVKDDHHRTRGLIAPDGREFGISTVPALFAMIGRIQEEVHRFAIEYQRSLRSHHGSTLDKIPGVGEKRRAALIKQFKSITAIRQASVEQLARVVPASTAQAIYEYFHKEEQS